MKKIILFLIRFYQKVLSPDQGILSYIISERFCRFHPTCSEYTYQAIERFGIVKGGWLGFKRVIRCHPFNSGGYDPVQEDKMGKGRNKSGSAAARAGCSSSRANNFKPKKRKKKNKKK